MRRIVLVNETEFRVFDRLALAFITRALPIDKFVKDFGVQLAFAVSTERELYKLNVYESPEARFPICTIENIIQQGDKSHDQAAFAVGTSDNP